MIGVFYWKHLSITLRSFSLIIPFAARARVQGVQPQGRKRRSHGARWWGILVQCFVLLLPDRSQIMSWNLCLYFSWELWMCLDYVKHKGLHLCVYESRAETHERFYIIEVHRHRFEMPARKVPFEKCTRWRKVCGRSAKDQIGDSIYSFFTISSERFAKGARKTRERRIHSSHVLPKMGCI